MKVYRSMLRQQFILTIDLYIRDGGKFIGKAIKSLLACVNFHHSPSLLHPLSPPARFTLSPLLTSHVPSPTTLPLTSPTPLISPHISHHLQPSPRTSHLTHTSHPSHLPSPTTLISPLISPHPHPSHLASPHTSSPLSSPLTSHLSSPLSSPLTSHLSSHLSSHLTSHLSSHLSSHLNSHLPPPQVPPQAARPHSRRSSAFTLATPGDYSLNSLPYYFIYRLSNVHWCVFTCV